MMEFIEDRINWAYRGYVVQRNPFTSMWNLSKGGYHIGSADTLLDAQRMIDEALGGAAT